MGQTISSTSLHHQCPPPKFTPYGPITPKMRSVLSPFLTLCLLVTFSFSLRTYRHLHGFLRIISRRMKGINLTSSAGFSCRLLLNTLWQRIVCQSVIESSGVSGCELTPIPSRSVPVSQCFEVNLPCYWSILQSQQTHTHPTCMPTEG